MRFRSQSGKGKVESPPALISIGNAKPLWEGHDPAVEIDLGDCGQEGLAPAGPALKAGDEFFTGKARLAEASGIEPGGVDLLWGKGPPPEREHMTAPVVVDDLTIGGGAHRDGGHLSVAFSKIGVELQLCRGLGLKRGIGKEGANHSGHHRKRACDVKPLSDGGHVSSLALRHWSSAATSPSQRMTRWKYRSVGKGNRRS